MAGKIQKKHFKSLAVIVSATALIVISSTMAFFNSTDATTNKFTGSRFDVMLTETKWDAEKAKSVIPGQELDKNPQVTNIEHTDGYIYLRVTVPGDTQMVDNDNGTPMNETAANVPMYKFMVSKGTTPETYDVDETFSAAQKVHTHWQLVEEPTYANGQFVYVYAYANEGNLTPLHQKEITEPLFDKLRLWNFNEEFDPDASHSVRVEALAIQTDLPGVDPGNISQVWSILKEEVDG